MGGFDHPWFKPLWRRLLVVFLPLAWGLFELSTGAVFWASLFLALGLYAGWNLLWAYPAEDGQD